MDGRNCTGLSAPRAWTVTNGRIDLSINQRYEPRVRDWTWRGLRFVFLALLLCQAYGYAQSGPRPPCGEDPVPPYPGLDDSPNVKFWSESELGRDWRPPACTGWAETGFSTLVTTAARFRYASGAEGLRRHIGAISELAGMRYWSTTHKKWQTLIVTAHALTGSQPNHRRQDFTPDEITGGTVVYFEQSDNLSGDAIYRMHITKASDRPGRSSR